MLSTIFDTDSPQRDGMHLGSDVMQTKHLILGAFGKALYPCIEQVTFHEWTFNHHTACIFRSGLMTLNWMPMELPKELL